MTNRLFSCCLFFFFLFASTNLIGQGDYTCTRIYNRAKATSGAFVSFRISLDNIDFSNITEEEQKALFKKGKTFRSPDGTKIILKDGANTMIADTLGKAIDSTRYHFLKQTPKGIFIGGTTDGKWGVFDKNLDVLLACKYDDLFKLIDPKFGWLIQEDGKWGMLDKNLEQVFAPKYDDVLCFNDSIYMARIGEEQILLNHKGQELRHFGKVCFSPRGGRSKFQPIFIKKAEKIGLYSMDGKEILPPLYDQIKMNRITNRGGWIELTNDQKKGVCNLEGNIIAPLEYDRIHFIQHGYNENPTIMTARKDKLLDLYIDDKLTEWTAQSFNRIYFLPNRGELLVIKKDGKFGLLNINSGIVIPPIYEVLKAMSDKNLIVKKDGKFGLINMKQEVVLPFEYDQLSGPTPGYKTERRARKDGKTFYVDENGKCIRDCE